MKKITAVIIALIMTSGLFMPVNSAKACGDINGDGEINSLDIISMIMHLNGSRKLTGEDFNTANTYTYGETFAKVDSQDLLALIQYVFKQIKTLPVNSAPVTTTTKTTTTTTKTTTTTTQVTTTAPVDVSSPMEYFSLGDKASDVTSKLGSPYRTLIDNGAYWRFYGSYNKFFLVWEVQGKIELMYANYGISTSSPKYTLIKDSNAGNKAYAAIKSNQITGDFTQTNPAITINTFEQIVFELTNAFRAFNGQSALTWQTGLAKAAQLHAEDMANNNYFDHTSLDGRTPWDRAKAQGVTADAENIIAGYSNPFYAFNGWVNSSGHRTNILGSHGVIGVGWAYSASSTYKLYGVQLFK